MIFTGCQACVLRLEQPKTAPISATPACLICAGRPELLSRAAHVRDPMSCECHVPNFRHGDDSPRILVVSNSTIPTAQGAWPAFEAQNGVLPCFVRDGIQKNMRRDDQKGFPFQESPKARKALPLGQLNVSLTLNNISGTGPRNAPCHLALWRAHPTPLHPQHHPAAFGIEVQAASEQVASEPRKVHLSHNQNPVLKWSTQNNVKNEEGGRRGYLCLGLSLTNLHLRGVLIVAHLQLLNLKTIACIGTSQTQSDHSTRCSVPPHPQWLLHELFWQLCLESASLPSLPAHLSVRVLLQTLKLPRCIMLDRESTKSFA